jgi:hypothetical protein
MLRQSQATQWQEAIFGSSSFPKSELGMAWAQKQSLIIVGLHGSCRQLGHPFA